MCLIWKNDGPRSTKKFYQFYPNFAANRSNSIRGARAFVSHIHATMRRGPMTPLGGMQSPSMYYTPPTMGGRSVLSTYGSSARPALAKTPQNFSETRAPNSPHTASLFQTPMGKAESQPGGDENTPQAQFHTPTKVLSFTADPKAQDGGEGLDESVASVESVDVGGLLAEALARERALEEELAGAIEAGERAQAAADAEYDALFAEYEKVLSENADGERKEIRFRARQMQNWVANYETDIRVLETEVGELATEVSNAELLKMDIHQLRSALQAAWNKVADTQAEFAQFAEETHASLTSMPESFQEMVDAAVEIAREEGMFDPPAPELPSPPPSPPAPTRCTEMGVQTSPPAPKPRRTLTTSSPMVTSIEPSPQPTKAKAKKRGLKRPTVTKSRIPKPVSAPAPVAAPPAAPGMEKALEAAAKAKAEAEARAAELEAQLALMNTKYQAEFARRRKIHDELVELRGNMRVFARVRPLLEPEMAKGGVSIVTTPDEETLVISPPGENRRARSFEFDNVFGPDASQGTVFDHVDPLITSLLDGKNVTIMAYGQTGSGKTYTMQGTPEAPGMIPRSLDKLFAVLDSHSEDSGLHFALSASFIEIYNGEFRDLLVEDAVTAAPGYGSGRPSSSFSSPARPCSPAGSPAGPESGTSGGSKISLTTIPPSSINSTDARGYRKSSSIKMAFNGLSSAPVTCLADIEALTETAESARAKASTSMNARSSRSHLMVVLNIEQTNDRTKTVHSSKLVLVDLAGSECVAASGVKGINLREAKYINRSLSALADVLAAIRNHNSHVPFRNSKLTLALSDSLAGESKVLLFVNIAPLASYLVEASHSASFGQSARRIVTDTSARASSSPRPRSRGVCTPTASPLRRRALRASVRNNTPQPSHSDQAESGDQAGEDAEATDAPDSPPGFVF